MKFVKQQRYECSLAVCAMVSGASYEDVQDYAWFTYPDRMGVGYRAHQVEEIWAEFGLPYIQAEKYFAAPVLDLSKVPLKGRGHLLYKNRKMKQWHHVAFESGMIFDGSDSRPRRLASWAKNGAFRKGVKPICQVLITHLTAANKGVN